MEDEETGSSLAAGVRPQRTPLRWLSINVERSCSHTEKQCDPDPTLEFSFDGEKQRAPCQRPRCVARRQLLKRTQKLKDVAVVKHTFYAWRLHVHAVKAADNSALLTPAALRAARKVASIEGVAVRMLLAQERRRLQRVALARWTLERHHALASKVSQLRARRSSMGRAISTWRCQLSRHVHHHHHVAVRMLATHERRWLQRAALACWTLYSHGTRATSASMLLVRVWRSRRVRLALACWRASPCVHPPARGVALRLLGIHARRRRQLRGLRAFEVEAAAAVAAPPPTAGPPASIGWQAHLACWLFLLVGVLEMSMGGLKGGSTVPLLLPPGAARSAIAPPPQPSCSGSNSFGGFALAISPRSGYGERYGAPCMLSAPASAIRSATAATRTIMVSGGDGGVPTMTPVPIVIHNLAPPPFVFPPPPSQLRCPWPLPTRPPLALSMPLVHVRGDNHEQAMEATKPVQCRWSWRRRRCELSDAARTDRAIGGCKLGLGLTRALRTGQLWLPPWMPTAWHVCRVAAADM